MYRVHKCLESLLQRRARRCHTEKVAFRLCSYTLTCVRHATTALLNIQSRLANVILNEHCAAYIRAVNKWCIAALEAIQLRCKGPDNVIAKRRDKLLDYSSVAGRKGQDEQWFEVRFCYLSKTNKLR